MANQLNDFMAWIGTALFILFMVRDVLKAKQSGTLWLPTDALALCGITLQLVGYLDVQNVSISGNAKEEDMDALLSNQLSIDSMRLTLCVFVAYLLPAMASTAYRGLWTTIAALLITISTHVATEFIVGAQLYASNKENSTSSGLWLIASGPVLLPSILGFVLLLLWALFNGKFFRDSLSRRIPIILSENSNAENEGHTRDWESFKEEMLKSWIVARVCRPEYVLARTPFSAGVAVVVSNCVIFLGVKIICLRSLLKGGFFLLEFQCIFIFVGWILILYRWFTAVLHFQIFREVQPIPRPRELDNISNVFIVRFSQVYNFSTDIVYRQYRLVGWDIETDGILLLVAYVGMRLCAPILKGLYGISIFMFALLICSLFALTSLSKAWWNVSGLVLDNKFIHRLCNVDTKLRNSESDGSDFPRYKAALDSVRMPAEDALSLWIANETYFNHVRHDMDRGYNKGRGHHCQALVTVIGICVADNDSRRFVDELGVPLESVKRYFPGLKEPLWRMTAQTLLQIMMEVAPSSAGDSVKNAMAAYSQAVELMDLVEFPDGVDMSVDVFGTSNAEAFQLNYAAKATAIDLARRKCSFPRGVAIEFIQKRFDKAKRTLEKKQLVGDFPSAGALLVSWQTVAASYSDYKVCKIILANPPSTVVELANKLLNLFAHVMSCCLLELPDLVVKCSREWAAEFKDDKIYMAAQIAGKAWGVIDAAEKMKEDTPTPTPASTTHLPSTSTTEIFIIHPN